MYTIALGALRRFAVGNCSPQVDRNSPTVETTLSFSKSSPGTILLQFDIAVTEITVQ